LPDRLENRSVSPVPEESKFLRPASKLEKWGRTAVSSSLSSNVVPLILASASPRRHELLIAAGIPHLVRPSSIPEDRHPGEDPRDYVRRLAEEKARSLSASDDDIVLGADTTVCLDNTPASEILGKPNDQGDARRMLRLLSGRSHWVHTGICLLASGRTITDCATTRVTFSNLTDDDISEYTRSGEPQDKAGGYAIQGLASRFVLSIEGNYQNVVGLPVSLVYHHLKSLGL
jgi:septum formation protein